MKNKFTHLDAGGHPQMVDVSDKKKSLRKARAEGWVLISHQIYEAIISNSIAKGNVLTVSEIAGIQAAKKTCDLIPLCHPISIDSLRLKCLLDTEKQAVYIESEAVATDVTGIEMEALTAVSVAALTVYDMCKAIDKGMVIQGIRLLSKSGGKSGDYVLGERQDQ